MQKYLLLTLFAFVPICLAQFGGGGGGMGRGAWGQKMFEGMIAELPPDVQQKARAIHDNQSLRPGQRRQQLMKLWDTLPIEQRPMPPFMRRLSPTLQEQVRGIWGNTNVPWRQRQRQFQQFWRALPADQRPMPPFLKRLPEPYKSQWLALRGQRGPGRFAQIQQLIQTMPQDVRSQLPFVKFGGTLPATRRAQKPLPHFLETLPEPYKSQWMAIRAKPTATRSEKIQELMQSLPQDLRSKLPFQKFGGSEGGRAGAPQKPPPHFLETLPEPYKSQWMAIRAQPSATRSAQIQQLMQSMPQDLRSKLPLPKFGGSEGGRAGAPQKPPPHFLETLPEPYKSQWMAIRAQPPATRVAQIQQLMQSMPEDLRARLPFPKLGGRMAGERVEDSVASNNQDNRSLGNPPTN
ncbi:unnamed protein product, partial [Mesorhabditis belari]|uniref:DUF3106 domain-containing protein n=1 Tax=Mesorhabditis belari TaxID=2138241 RepID=A0AAF3FR31_9BILA